MHCQFWLPLASIISKAAIAHLGNVLCPYKVIGTGFPGTYLSARFPLSPRWIAVTPSSSALHSADPLLRLSPLGHVLIGLYRLSPEPCDVTITYTTLL